MQLALLVICVCVCVCCCCCHRGGREEASVKKEWWSSLSLSLSLSLSFFVEVSGMGVEGREMQFDGRRMQLLLAGESVQPVKRRKEWRWEGWRDGMEWN